MIGAISNVSFKCEADLINAPGKYSIPPKTEEMPADSFEKKSNKGAIAAGVGAAAILAAVAGLGYAVKSGNLTKIENTDAIQETTKKLWAKAKNIGFSIGEQANKLYDNTIGKLFSKSAEKAAEGAEQAAEKA